MELSDDFAKPEFLGLLRKRDHEAIERLVRAYTRHLHNASLGMGFDHSASEELVQDVWITFFEKSPTFDGRSHVRTYPFGILSNKVAEKLRERKFEELDETVERMVDARFDGRGRWLIPPLDPESFVLRLETGAIIEKCLEGLSQPQRMAFVLKEVEDCRNKEICAALGVSQSNLGVLLFRARNKLRECVEKRHKGEA